MYLNYYASEVNDPDDNLPIGIILCTEKDSITVEYALGGLSNNIFGPGMCCICRTKSSRFLKLKM